MADPLEWRSFTNKSGKTYDATATSRPFAEDMNLIGDALVEGSKAVTLTFRSYTTTERDAIASPQTGMVIWNSTSAQLEVYNGAAWGSFAGASSYPFTSSASNPSGAPTQLGQRHLNTSTRQLWEGVGLSSQADWAEVFLGGPP